MFPDRFAIIRLALLPLLEEQGLGAIKVVTSYQPASAGRENGPCLYFFQLPAGSRYGWQSRKSTWDPTTETMTRSESQVMRETFQMMGLNDSAAGPSAIDLTTMAAMLIGSQGFREQVTPQGLGIERIADIRTPNFSNDHDQFEYSPSFDFTVSFTSSILQQSRAVERVELNTLSV